MNEFSPCLMDRLVFFSGKILHNREGRFVEYSGDEKNDHYAIITRKGSLSRLRAGFISRVTDETIIPALCSRPALPKSDCRFFHFFTNLLFPQKRLECDSSKKLINALF